MQLGQLQKIESRLIDLGYQLLAISPDRPEKLAESVRENQLTYRLLSDSEMAAAQAFGLAFRMPDREVQRYRDSFSIDLEDASGEDHHLLPVPAVFLVDREGRVLFQYANPDYKVRLEPGVLLAAAEAYR